MKKVKTKSWKRYHAQAASKSGRLIQRMRRAIRKCKFRGVEMKKTKHKCAAIVTIHDAAKMTPAGRRRIAKWIDRQKTILLKHSEHLGHRYVAKYIYV